MFTALLAFSIGAPAAPQFQVENKCPCQFVVTNKVVPKKMPPAKGCVCAGECKCADGTCPGSCPVQAAPAVQYQYVAHQGRWGRIYYTIEPVTVSASGVVTGNCLTGTCTSLK